MMDLDEKAHLKPRIRKDDQIKDLKQALAKMQEQLAVLTGAPAAIQATASKRWGPHLPLR